MQRTFVITGAASGLGEAAADRLKAKGHRVIGVDLNGSDVNVDLGTERGRLDMVEQVRALAPDGSMASSHQLVRRTSGALAW
jgi:NAD(P)-dependent dehydrogenase (short-subunit alcohol dehydrogenase family)